MNTLIHFLSAILEFFCIYIPAKRFLQTSIHPRKKDCFYCLITAILTILIPSHFPVAIWLLGQFTYLFYVTTLKKDSFIHRMILYCLSYGSVLLAQFLLICVLSLTPISSENTIMPLLGNFLTIILLMVLFHLLPGHILYRKIINAALPYQLLLLNSYLVLTGILLFLKLDTHKFYANLLYLVIIIFLIITTNICILYYDQKLYLKQQELLSYKKNLPIYKSLIDTIRSNQHEFTNRMQAFQHLPSICNDYESICHALQENAQNYNNPAQAYPLLQINMPLLAATLYNLYCIAERLHIHITFDISTIQLESHAPEYQLADFASILTQNAIEACKAGDRIYIRLLSDGKTTHFEIRNPVNHMISNNEINKFFQKNYSTKNRNGEKIERGLGLFYLLNTISQYKGYIEANCTMLEQQFILIFVLDV